MAITRSDFDRVINIVNSRSDIIERLAHDVDLQFKRIAQIQAELDLMKRAWEKNKTGS